MGQRRLRGLDNRRRRREDRGRRGGLGRDSNLKVDERLGATTLRPLLGRLRVALGDHPKPGLVVDNLHLLAALKLRLELGGSGVAVVPLAEVDKHAPELLAVLAGLRHHVNALDKAKLQGVEDRADPLLADVLEDTGDTEAVDDRLRLARLDLGLRVGVGKRHFDAWFADVRWFECKILNNQKSISIFCRIHSFLSYYLTKSDSFALTCFEE